MAGYLKFIEVNDTGKTKVFSVLNNDNQFLGQIKWMATWRKYTFNPINSVFDVKCLIEVVSFINDLMSQRKHGGR